MHVDHLIPEHLLGKPKELAKILHDYGLPDSFDLNDYENWLPACASCNQTKKSEPFEPTPIIQRYFSRARENAPEVRKLAQRTISNQKTGKALGTLQLAFEEGTISDVHRASFITLAEQFAVDMRISNPPPPPNVPPSDKIMTFTENKPRPPKPDKQEFRISPFHTVLYENGAMKIVQAPYGIGYQPTDPKPHSSFYCGHCSRLGPWQGARCMSCGCLCDGD
ncbi:MAG: hypothetical protein AB8B71_00470 [Paracoccaceae bacterium]